MVGSYFSFDDSQMKMSASAQPAPCCEELGPAKNAEMFCGGTLSSAGIQTVRGDAVLTTR
jgi:hypothetical protein